MLSDIQRFYLILFNSPGQLAQLLSSRMCSLRFPWELTRKREDLRVTHKNNSLDKKKKLPGVF